MRDVAHNHLLGRLYEQCVIAPLGIGKDSILEMPFIMLFTNGGMLWTGNKHSAWSVVPDLKRSYPVCWVNGGFYWCCIFTHPGCQCTSWNCFLSRHGMSERGSFPGSCVWTHGSQLVRIYRIFVTWTQYVRGESLERTFPTSSFGLAFLTCYRPPWCEEHQPHILATHALLCLCSLGTEMLWDHELSKSLLFCVFLYLVTVIRKATNTLGLTVFDIKCHHPPNGKRGREGSL